jgi:DTW domain-containing protein YfiP
MFERRTKVFRFFVIVGVGKSHCEPKVKQSQYCLYIDDWKMQVRKAFIIIMHNGETQEYFNFAQYEIFQ